MPLTLKQIAAINHHNSNLQIIACAGSGKTEVVARRVVELLKTGKAKPGNIVAFTFTDKAAAELKERIHLRCQESLGEVHGMAEMYVGTIHGYCLDLLRTEVPNFLKYDVLNEVQQCVLVDRNSKRSGLTNCADLKGQPLKRYVDTPRYRAALDILREAETNAKALKGCSLVQGLGDYRKLLEEKRFFDYSSILEAGADALASDNGIRKRLAKRIRHVIVDEYQDVNPIQEKIVNTLHDLGATICVVGDDDQTLYQWRGSSVDNIRTFAKRYPKVTEIRLEDNFRSSEGIVEAARPFIEKNQERLKKSMKPTNAQAYEPGDIVALAFKNPAEEARHIANTIKALRGLAIGDDKNGRGISWSDMAILLRSVKSNADPITTALDTADIKYVIVGMSSLFGTLEAQAARQLFYFLAGRPTITKAGLEKLWLSAGVGLANKDVARAVKTAVKYRDSLDKPTERFSFYSLQRTFQTFLEEVGLRDEKVPHNRGEIVFYNLGKFSQVISDFETIHYHSEPTQKYTTFASFLEHQAEEAYPEGWQDNQHANPDAVRIMTVHQAKGLQWPVVFIPALLRNRFPGAKHGGRTVWHLLPKDAVKNQQRYEGTIEDERRVFYVAMTRSQKFLHMTWAPIAGKNNLYVKPSEFWEDVLVSKFVKRRAPDFSSRKRLTPEPRKGVCNVVFSFSDIKSFFECPYQFKLRVLYGFNVPLHEALGYGRSLHNALAEVHARAIRKDFADESESQVLVETHLHTPYAYAALRQKLEGAAERVITHYITDNKNLFDKIEFSEKQIEIPLDDGVSVVGRIDLVRRIDTNETTIVDLKASDRTQPEDVTETQLNIYALGYERLTGRNADKVEIYLLDERKAKARSVDSDLISYVKLMVKQAANALRSGSLPPAADSKKCSQCDYRGMCSEGQKAIKNG
jgi:DNA helicase-2/ATP-dependent DNA helicase PcrA